ncbi:MAG: tRNA (adenine(22)-N(1))-methyltransferase TrmK [Planctomycetaceae bacterium]|nr:tRNA (adenine(22)-N(1))-methyltransferase TrmK [Planctomycetaceae bacterium]
MLPRTLEPELMDSVEDAVGYDRMDHSTVNRVFVDDLLAAWDNGQPTADPKPLAACRLLDVGTGTAQIPVELASRVTDCRVVAIDLADEMLRLARRNVSTAGFDERISVEHGDAKAMPFADDRFDGVISNSIVHHIPKPAVVLDEMIRVLAPGGLLFVRDLSRPPDLGTVNHLVDMYAGDETAHARQMFRQSLHAALTVEEVSQLLTEAGLPANLVRQTTDRHWTISGRYDRQ